MAAKRLLLPALCSLLFLLTAIVFIPYPGLQNDEVFFANPIYSPDSTFYRAEILGMQIPFMVMSYSGALKTWLYQILWQYLFDPSAWSLRLPVVFAGIATLFLTWEFTRRLAGTRAAAITTLLLATDISFQLTNTFDWGPVALQHLLLIGGLLSIFRWVQQRAVWSLLFGAFLWGLGLWDKALLIWPLLAITVATLAVYPVETFHRLRSWAAVAAIGAFLAGAAPLIWYNIDRPAATATTNAHFVIVNPGQKLRVLVTTIDGSALFDYMVRGNWAASPRQPDGILEKTSVRVAAVIGEHRHSWMIPGLLLGLIIGLVRRTRLTIYFTLIVFLTWVQMFVTKDTGGAAHHLILLWPFPLIMMGIAFAAIPVPAATLITAVLLIQNLLTANEYLSEFARFGPTVNWTDALFPLSDAIDNKMASDVEIVDWGYLNGIRLLHEGDLPLRVASDPLLKPTMTAGDLEIVRAMIDSPAHLFIGHTAGNEMFPGLNDKLRKAASQLGYDEKVERVIPDKNGRPIFELFRFEKQR